MAQQPAWRMDALQLQSQRAIRNDVHARRDHRVDFNRLRNDVFNLSKLGCCVDDQVPIQQERLLGPTCEVYQNWCDYTYDNLSLRHLRGSIEYKERCCHLSH